MGGRSRRNGVSLGSLVFYVDQLNILYNAYLTY